MYKLNSDVEPLTILIHARSLIKLNMASYICIAIEEAIISFSCYECKSINAGMTSLNLYEMREFRSNLIPIRDKYLEYIRPYRTTDVYDTVWFHNKEKRIDALNKAIDSLLQKGGVTNMSYKLNSDLSVIEVLTHARKLIESRQEKFICYSINDAIIQNSCDLSKNIYYETYDYDSDGRIWRELILELNRLTAKYIQPLIPHKTRLNSCVWFNDKQERLEALDKVIAQLENNEGEDKCTPN